MTIARAANFLSNREKTTGGDRTSSAFVEGPVSRIVSTLQDYKMIALRDIAGVSGVPADTALTIILDLIKSGQAEVLERDDRPNEKYLSLTVPHKAR